MSKQPAPTTSTAESIAPQTAVEKSTQRITRRYIKGSRPALVTRISIENPNTQAEEISRPRLKQGVYISKPNPEQEQSLIIASAHELHSWSNDDGDLKWHQLKGIQLTNYECDGRSLEIQTRSEVRLPFKVPFSSIDSVFLTASAGTTNQVQEGFYLFGVRLH